MRPVQQIAIRALLAEKLIFFYSEAALRGGVNQNRAPNIADIVEVDHPAIAHIHLADFG